MRYRLYKNYAYNIRSYFIFDEQSGKSSILARSIQWILDHNNGDIFAYNKNIAEMVNNAEFIMYFDQLSLLEETMIINCPEELI